LCGSYRGEHQSADAEPRSGRVWAPATQRSADRERGPAENVSVAKLGHDYV